MARDYPFEFPVNIPGGFVGLMTGKLDKAGLWPRPESHASECIPRDLAVRLSEAQTQGTGIKIEQVDLDTISDHVWSKVVLLLPKR